MQSFTVGLRLRFIVAAAVTGLGIGAASAVLRHALDTSPLFAWKAAAAFAIVALVAGAGVAAHHPFSRLGPANVITLSRAALAALLAALIGETPSRETAWLIVGVGTLIAVLDGFDGSLARRSGTASAFGARFDMETDGLFILVLSILVWQHGKAGAWITAGGLLRYAFIAAGGLLPWMARPLTPTFRGKAMAVAHMVGLLVAIGPIIPPELSSVAAALTLAALIWSFGADVRRLWRARTAGG